MIWQRVVRPLLFCLPAETAHDLAMTTFSAAMKLGPMSQWCRWRLSVVDPRLATNLFGLRFENPIGLAAGFDKSARWFPALGCLGFSHIEVGTITRLAQLGNDRPRLFRLPRDRALINRMGFNNPGANSVAIRLAKRRHKQRSLVLGINIGKSKVASPDEAVEDYLASFERLFPYADYLAINVSSPNTPGLRQLQDRQPLAELLSAIMQLNNRLAREGQSARKPIVLKIAPDLEGQQLEDIVAVARETKLDGLIAANTTVSRGSLMTPAKKIFSVGPGGVSGAPLTAVSRQLVSRIYQLTGGQVPIIGVGGIMHGEDAWQMIRAGASLLQIYTGFVYGGPALVRQMNRYLLSRLDEFKFEHISHAVGSGVDKGGKE
jgi:dihydroorotate dehydrogenase